MLRVYSVLYLESIWSRPKAIQNDPPPKQKSSSFIINNDNRSESSLSQEEVFLNDDHLQPIKDKHKQALSTDESNSICNKIQTTPSLQKENDLVSIIATNHSSDETLFLHQEFSTVLLCPPEMKASIKQPPSPPPSLQKQQQQQQQQQEQQESIHLFNKSQENEQQETKLLPYSQIDTWVQKEEELLLLTNNDTHPHSKGIFSPKRILYKAKSSLMMEENVFNKIKRKSSHFLLDHKREKNDNDLFTTRRRILSSLKLNNSSTDSLKRKSFLSLTTDKGKLFTKKMKNTFSFHTLL